MLTSLYIHIPFCVKKCIYCDFFSVPYDEDLALRYVDALVSEIALRKNDVGTLRTVYIGGGTPTTLSLICLFRLFRAATNTFSLAEDAEVTIEANPGTINIEKLRALTNMGVNRLSLGVQSFDNKTLKLLGRIYTFEDVLKAVAAVRDSPVNNFSIDLIYGIPGQTLAEWQKALSIILELRPSHVSSYELTPEKGTPLSEKIAIGELSMPSEDTIIEMYYYAIDRLVASGYRHYEISNFALPDRECSHNLNYWNRGEYLGIGAGAHSFANGIRMKNTSDLKKYMDELKKGSLPIEESILITSEDAIKEFIFLGLRKMKGLSITACWNTLRIDIIKASRDLIVDGFLESDGECIRLTRRGIVISSTIIARLLGKLEKEGLGDISYQPKGGQ